MKQLTIEIVGRQMRGIELDLILFDTETGEKLTHKSSNTIPSVRDAVDMIALVVDRHNVSEVFIDPVGYGIAVVDLLQMCLPASTKFMQLREKRVSFVGLIELPKPVYTGGMRNAHIQSR